MAIATEMEAKAAPAADESETVQLKVESSRARQSDADEQVRGARLALNVAKKVALLRAE